MKYIDLYPENGRQQRIHCDCGEDMILVFDNFNEKIENIEFKITNLPFLYCEKCRKRYLSDNSRISLILLFEEAKREHEKAAIVKVDRNKKQDIFYHDNKLQFNYDADDYYYIPGLSRPEKDGFLTPIFFNKEVLIKFDNWPGYEISFASNSYGDIETKGSIIPFGINKNGNVIMWLGDIITLPESEQNYLKSENIESDHDIGGDFYDSQLECKFVDTHEEGGLLKSSEIFLQKVRKKFKIKLVYLNQERVNLINDFKPLIIFKEDYFRNRIDNMNKIFIEALNGEKIDELVEVIGLPSYPKKGLKSLKKMEYILTCLEPEDDARKIMLPFFVLYDLRIICDHLIENKKLKELEISISKRLDCGDIFEKDKIYFVLLKKMTESYNAIIKILR
ncbi:MAG: hypothetical protein PHQ01_01420 [Candidatus Pacebacteria bacterium]|nr:hypothetical protein [Candidatus Paceibacterota bacterium]